MNDTCSHDSPKARERRAPIERALQESDAGGYGGFLCPECGDAVHLASERAIPTVSEWIARGEEVERRRGAE